MNNSETDISEATAGSGYFANRCFALPVMGQVTHHKMIFAPVAFL
jgi:hypothetical protein